MSDVGRASSEPVELCELGPLGFRTTEGWTAVRGERTAAVLAALSLAGDRGTRTDALVDHAWPHDPPPTARQSLANVVNRLRSSFGSGVIDTDGHGYRLGSTVRSDRARFLAEVADAETLVDRDADRALALIRRALPRWRGSPWVDVDRPELVAGDRAHLERTRIRAQRVEALALHVVGNHDDAATALDAALDNDPTDEVLWAALAASLAATGRRPLALDTISRARRALAEKGLDLGRSLRRLEDELLAGAEPEVRPQRVSAPLPPVPSHLHGRSDLVAELDRLVEERRLTTLVGPGGVGKTTAALAVAHRASKRRPVVLVDLSPIRDGRRCEDALAAAVGVEPSTNSAPLHAAVAHLAGEDTLVVVDNCEHVLDAASSMLAAVVAGCPRVAVLATSRAVLGVADERVVPVEPLDPRAAVDLFHDRAEDAGVPLPTTSWAAAVAALCAHLDHLPLAIELAAKRTVALSPPEILDDLDARFALLRDPNATGRASSLRSTIEWSWEPLDHESRRTMVFLAAFASGAGIDALSVVLGHPRHEIVDRIQSLASRSLVRVQRPVHAPNRIGLLETVRAFVLDVADSGMLRAARDAHLRWVVSFVESVVGRIGGNEPVLDPLGRLDPEAHEVRAALDHAASDPELAATGLALAARLRTWWRGRDAAEEGVERLRTLLNIGAGDIRTRADASAALATLLRLTGANDAVIDEVLEDIRPLVDRVDDPAERNHLELRLLEAAFRVDDPDIAVRLRRLATAAQADGTSEDGMALHLLTAWTIANDPESAAAVAAETVEASRHSTIACQAHAVELVGLSALAVDRTETVADTLATALDRFDETDQRLCSIHCCESVAWWLTAEGRVDDASVLLAATEGVRRRHGRNRAGFEMQAIEGIRRSIGELPPADLDAEADATIALARRLLGR